MYGWEQFSRQQVGLGCRAGLQGRAELTFCLSRIFMAKWFPVSLCFTSITRPKEPVPRVLIRSN